MSIYTRKGDKGKTFLFNKLKGQSKFCLKDSPAVNAIGSLDELNSFLGIIISQTERTDIKEVIKKIQNNLMKISSILAGTKLNFSAKETEDIEKLIDRLDRKLPHLKNFILPNGSKVACLLQFSRALARRSERMVVSLSKRKRVEKEVLRYLNRLSDFLFMLAREENFKVGIKEEVWKAARGK